MVTYYAEMWLGPRAFSTKPLILHKQISKQGWYKKKSENQKR